MYAFAFEKLVKQNKANGTIDFSDKLWKSKRILFQIKEKE